MPTCAELAKEMQALREEVTTLKESLEMFNGLYETVKKKSEDLAKENKLLKDENQKIVKRMSDIEQYSRLNNVEVKGIPSTQGEDCLAIVKSIGDKVGCPITASDIDTVHRVPAKNGTNIIARSCSRDKKFQFASKSRKARLTTRAVGSNQTDDSPVYINDHLTPERKRLFAQAQELKREKQWKYLWTDNCTIKARQAENARVYRISCLEDLRIFQ